MYAIVRCGGRQEKATVDEVLTVDTLDGEAGSSVDLPALLVVDDDKVISDPAELSRYQVTAEILGTIAGPKINMIQFKNKTGYRRRLGHRQKYTQVKITSISAGRKSAPAGRKATADGASSAASKTAAAGKASTASKPASGRTSASRSTAGKTSAAKTPAAKTPAAKAPAAKAPAAKAPAAEKAPAARKAPARKSEAADSSESGKKD